MKKALTLTVAVLGVGGLMLYALAPEIMPALQKAATERRLRRNAALRRAYNTGPEAAARRERLSGLIGRIEA